MPKEDELFDQARAQQVQVVLRVQPMGSNPGDKYAWSTARVLNVLKNTSKQVFGEKLEIAYYSFAAGLPDTECTVYLEPYNDTPDHPWKLLGGSAERGVSHVR